jgi:hypothetical protein
VLKRCSIVLPDCASHFPSVRLAGIGNERINKSFNFHFASGCAGTKMKVRRIDFPGVGRHRGTVTLRKTASRTANERYLTFAI